METPSGILAKRITDQLVKAGLVSDRKKDEMILKLANGRISAEDWRVSIEPSERKEAKDE